jgi:predicted 3-demethylubiquinone-9 3-methyltransferase (glyoxalase superfamily)
MASKLQIVPCLWFDTQAEEAAKFYVSIFDDSKIESISYFNEEGFEKHGKPAGSVMTVAFRLSGLPYTALNGGPHFKFTEAISLQVFCDTQKEVDRYWKVLSEGGSEGHCGWLKDKFGLSWQVVPRILEDMVRDPDASKRQRATKAFLGMRKFDIAALERAFAGK